MNPIDTWQIQSKESLMHQFHIDMPLMIAVLLASGVSAIAIFSASNSNENFLMSHLISICLLYTSPSPRDRTRSRMPSSA